MTNAASFSLFQTMAGARHGGAELFFERLAGAFQAAGLNQTVAIKPDAERMQRLSKAGITTLGCGFSPLLAPWHRHQLGRQIRASGADVVLSWMNRASAMTPACGRPHVARLGGFYNLKYYRKCDWLVGNTRDIADYLIAEGWPRDRVHYQINFVPDGLAGPVFQPAGATTSTGSPVIVALGRLHRNKAFDTMLRAFSGLQDGRLWLAGTGPEEVELRDLAAELGIAERVQFLGWQADPQAIIRAADIFVCPSRHEPFGNVIAEAMACAKPIVATATNGARELIEDGVNGVLVPVDDDQALAAAIDNLLANPTAAAQLAAGGRRHWQAHLSPEKITSAWMGFLAGVVG